jgi:hypothetical protein
MGEGNQVIFYFGRLTKHFIDFILSYTCINQAIYTLDLG